MTSSRYRWLTVVAVTGVLAIAPPARAEVRTARPSPRDHAAYAREIAEASRRYAVPERLIWAVIRVESGFDHRAVSPRGARGLMQLTPETAAILGVRDPFDPRQNIHAGTRHLRAMMERFRHDVRLAVAAYNAGERPVVQYGGVPPYPETREYVTQVLRFYGMPDMPRPIERAEIRGNGVRRIVEANGSVTYTNIAFGGVGALLP
jgi:soluble lytic murein transglycosylase-like protein